MPTLRDWLDQATILEKTILRKLAKLSETGMYTIASGTRSPSAEMAGRLEAAITEINKGSKGRLPDLNRMDLCNTCANCPYAQRCLKK